jgi:hypothetical protein
MSNLPLKTRFKKEIEEELEAERTAINLGSEDSSWSGSDEDVPTEEDLAFIDTRPTSAIEADVYSRSEEDEEDELPETEEDAEDGSERYSSDEIDYYFPDIYEYNKYMTALAMKEDLEYEKKENNKKKPIRSISSGKRQRKKRQQEDKLSTKPHACKAIKRAPTVQKQHQETADWTRKARQHR